ncbi:MAG: hypothetical protein WDM94_04030 [Bauldia sp.]
MLRAIRLILIGVPLVLGATLASAMGLTLVTSAGVPVAVVARGGLAPALAAVAGANGAILQVRGDTVIAIADDAGFVARLYRAGAMLVVRADGGCGFAAPVKAAI